MTNPTDTAGPTGNGSRGGSVFFDWLRGLGLVRPGDGWVGGVCAGIAARTGLDPLVVRGVVLVIAVLGGPVLFLYAVAWALLPDWAGRIHAEDVVRGRFEPAAIAIGAILVVSLLPVTRGLWWQGPPAIWNMPDWLSTTLGVAWTLALTAGVIWLVVYLSTAQARRSTSAAEATHGTVYAAAAQPSAPSAEAGSGAAPTHATFPAPVSDAPSAQSGPSDWERVAAEARKGWEEGKRGVHQAHRDLQEWRSTLPGAGHVAIVLGLAVIAGALTGAAVAGAGRPDSALVWGLAAATAVLGLGIVVAGIRGRSSGGMGFFSFIAVLALLVAGVFPSGTEITPFGTRVWNVAAERSDTASYAMFAGAPTVDLTRLRPSADREVDLWLAFGGATVLIPDDGSVTVESHAVVGTVHRPNTEDGSGPGGFLLDDEGEFGSGTGSSSTTVRVWMVAGNVDVEVAQ